MIATSATDIGNSRNQRTGGEGADSGAACWRGACRPVIARETDLGFGPPYSIYYKRASTACKLTYPAERPIQSSARPAMTSREGWEGYEDGPAARMLAFFVPCPFFCPICCWANLVRAPSGTHLASSADGRFAPGCKDDMGQKKLFPTAFLPPWPPRPTRRFESGSGVAGSKKGTFSRFDGDFVRPRVYSASPKGSCGTAETAGKKRLTL